MSTGKKEFGTYYLGLDIGTNSVGWAVTDENYKLQKLNGKTLWGTRLFDEAKSAEDRRLHRNARRRLQRRAERLRLLQELFAEEIAKIDPGFFLRMAESKFYEEDKSVRQPYALFCDPDFTDKDYHKRFPTIHHLRKALIENRETFDVRLVYLAVHNILKYRGHFLFEGQDMKAISSFDIIYQDVRQCVEEEMEMDFSCGDPEKMGDILQDRTLGIQQKTKELEALFGGKEKRKKQVLKLLSGGKVKFSDLFPDADFEDAEKKDVQFSSARYEEEEPLLDEILQERAYVIRKLKALYDWGILAAIRGEEPYLSFSKVRTFDKHAEDLKRLKRAVKTFCPEKYDEIFRKAEKGKNNYCAYIGMSKKNGRKIPIEHRCTQEELCKYLHGILKGKLPENDADYRILGELEANVFLPKQITKENGTIPYQLHLEELKIILENAGAYLPFLKETDENGLTVEEKILQLMKFRIPYYVGPLNDRHKENGFAWVVKKTGEKVFPWNFEEVVDVQASAEAFIRRMTNKCTYLAGADVLPKNSLLYSRFMVLNELNNLKIDGEPISVELKQSIFENLFQKYKKVTRRKLLSYLRQENFPTEEDAISGIDGDFKGSLASYIEIRSIIGDKIHQTEMVEEIIKGIVLFGDDRKLLRQSITTKFGEALTQEEIKKLCTLKYSGWGRLSREFLEEIEDIDPQTGEYVNLITAMWQTNQNLMQLLGSDYGFYKGCRAYNEEHGAKRKKLDYSAVQEMYVSPAVKRALWQVLTIVKEIRKFMGHDPQRIFIEMARGGGEKKRTESRKAKLIGLYKQCRNEERDWISELEQKEDSQLRQDRLYLYYTQMGRCMYSGEPIPLSQLFDKNLYDIDHIYPQSKTKDDSLDNRVLVKREFNAKKTDQYPIPREWRAQQREFWSVLLKQGFISKEKWNRLTRKTPFTDQELAGFISRQIVETRQSSKAAAQILGEVFENSQIVYVKAGNVSEFRRKFDLIKVREVNDFHHAQDAFLNIVVGNVYYSRFTNNPVNFIKNHAYRDYSLNRMYDFDFVKNGRTVWKPGEDGTIKLVKDTLDKKNVLFTRYATETKGGFFDQMLMKKGKGQVPIKGSDPRLADIEKYGGYNKAAGAYFFLVKHEKKGKPAKTIEFVPVYLAARIEKEPQLLEQYCVQDLGLNNPVVLVRKIKINTLFKVDGFCMHLSARTGPQLIFKGAQQLYLDKNSYRYVKKISNYLMRCDKANVKAGGLEVTSFDGISLEQNTQLYDQLLYKVKETIYNIRLSAQVKTLTEKRDVFLTLSLGEQCAVLNECLHMFQCNPVAANLKRIGGPETAGRLSINSNISKCGQISIINQSPTGVFQQELDLQSL